MLQFADASGFTTSGGVGECIHSDGRMIDVVWWSNLEATSQIMKLEKTVGRDGKARKTLNKVAAQSASFTTHCRRFFAVSAHSESSRSRFMYLPAG